jgi:precorrin-4/cobalt-precorrin-4 C11-methyltransferase
MTIHFIGAGPGAADLITVRGRDLLARCPVCLYAGSLIPAQLLEHCPPGARLVDSAPLTLDQIEAEYVQAAAAGLDVARLHSGDLSLYSALAEQLRRLRRRGIAYTLTPGVPAFAAAAALLGRELTVPGVAQSVVLTRMPGRASRMPESERLTAFAATGATLAIHLAIQALDAMVEQLLPHHGADCPVAVVMRASWPDERVVRATLGTIRAALAAQPMERTALVFVGEALEAADFQESALYSPQYPRRFRQVRPEADDPDAAIPAALRGAQPPFAPGTVWLAGAGPGDPGLLTLDALAGLAQADVVVHDALVDPRVLALARPGAQLRPAGKRGGRPSMEQADITTLLIELARSGLRVLRLKGGDPFVFGRGGEEMLALAAAGVPLRVVPGITSGLGALASAWIPATMRGVSQAILFTTGHGADGEDGPDWAALARTRQPLVIYMGLRTLPAIVHALMQGGLDGRTPAAVIACATLPDQQVVVSTLECLAAEAHTARVPAPALVVVGDIVQTRMQFLEALRSHAVPPGDAAAAAPGDRRCAS